MEPSEEGATELFIVSGYISAAFIEQLTQGSYRKRGGAVSAIPKPQLSTLNIVFGMYLAEGVLESDHAVFSQEAVGLERTIFYFLGQKGTPPPDVHSKLYIWYKDSTPYRAFAGSMNASSRAFFAEGREVAVECDPNGAHQYAMGLKQASKRAVEVNPPKLKKRSLSSSVLSNLQTSIPIEGLSKVNLPLTKRGLGSEIHTKSGLNWGQREGRDKDQAYIPIPAAVIATKFFPPIGVRFTLRTVDGASFTCATQQDEGKAFTSIDSNAKLGLYLREKLGVASGEFVTLENLRAHGRITVDVYAEENGDYILDFEKRTPPIVG